MNILIYCGARHGSDALLVQTAHDLGIEIARRDWQLIYGGGGVGLMGVIARAVLEHGGRVTGIIPTFMHTAEIALHDCTELIEVESMHVRKQMMIERADAILALPGGFGTLDELFEALTWRQLGLHDRPIGLLNVGGYYNNLLALRDDMIRADFVSSEVASFLTVAETHTEILDRLAAQRNTSVLPTHLERS